MLEPLLEGVPIADVTVSSSSSIGLFQCEGFSEKQEFNCDDYMLVFYSGMSSKEISLKVDFLKNEFYGDILWYGQWDELDEKQAREVYMYLETNAKLLRRATW